MIKIYLDSRITEAYCSFEQALSLTNILVVVLNSSDDSNFRSLEMDMSIFLSHMEELRPLVLSLNNKEWQSADLKEVFQASKRLTSIRAEYGALLRGIDAIRENESSEFNDVRNSTYAINSILLGAQNSLDGIIKAPEKIVA